MQKSPSIHQETTERKSKPIVDALPSEDQHPDPVLSRLRLNDQFGKPITDPKLFFRDCKVVGFFFSTLWKCNPDSFQNKVLELCNRNPHRFKCIYVSIDTSKEEFDLATKEKPWINMIWEDGSNVIEEGNLNQEDNVKFMTPEDQESIEKIINGGGVTIKEDSRAISRVGLCSGLNVMFTPSLAIYNLETKTWLEKNVSIRCITSKEKRENALETWERGERLGLSWMDIVIGFRWAILASLVGIVYTLLVQSDDSYNIVHLVEKFLAPSSTQTSAPSHDQPLIAHYNEF